MYKYAYITVTEILEGKTGYHLYRRSQKQPVPRVIPMARETRST